MNRIFIQFKSNIFFTYNRFCNGGDLFDLIKLKKYFKEADAIKIMKKLIMAVLYIH